MQIITGDNFLTTVPAQSALRDKQIDTIVLEIIDHVQSHGDQALIDYTAQFDQADLQELRVTGKEFKQAKGLVSKEFLKAIAIAAENISLFHQKQTEESWFMTKPNGVMLGQQVTAIEKVGIYIPGGKATYPSTVLMNVIPAHIAGVQQIAMATPPRPDGSIDPHILAAAQHVGVDCIYKMGGAQAIAAFAYGTETVAKVDKIVGPGNDYVARAKKWVYGDVAIDMIAGPSEICIVADETAPAAFVAADLLSQAEHDEAAKPICITLSEAMAACIKHEVSQQLNKLDRKDIAVKSIKNHGLIIVAADLAEAFAVVNALAPEHLQLMIKNAPEHITAVKHAGAIFLGNYAPEPLGDYLAGPNHTLPTGGTARFASPLGVYDFLKKSSVIQYSKAALLKDANAIETLAVTEGLDAHANSIRVRRQERRTT